MSGFVIEMEVSNSLESSVFVETLKRAMKKSKPEIFNSDQGSQFTAIEWLKILQENKIAISMDGRGRCPRQYFRGTIMAFGQTGRSLLKGIHGCLGSRGKFTELF